MKRLGVVAGALVVVAGLAGPVEAAPAPVTQAVPGCSVAARQVLGGGCGSVAFAHRGAYGAEVDENTKKALEAAFAKGAHMETDVWLTQDRGFIVLHDGTLDRTTNCKGSVADWTIADIQEQCRTEPNGQRVPGLKTFLKVLAGNPGQLMMVELKGNGWFENDNKPLERLRDATAQAGVLKRVFYTNEGDTAVIEALRDVEPDARTAWKQQDDENVTVKRAKELSVDAVVLRPREWSSRAKVRSFRNKGLRPWSLLVNDKPAWKALIRRGVTGVMTDEPGAFREVCREMST